MNPSASPADWNRLGELLTRRRVELDPRYQNRTVFCDERGLDYRLAYDIEEAKRSNFRKTTLAGVAAAYAVTPDSLHAALRGGVLERTAPPRLAAVPSPAVPREPREDDADEVIEALVAHDEVLVALWHYPDPKGPVGKLLDRRKRLALMRTWIRDDPRAVLDDEGRHRETET